MPFSPVFPPSLLSSLLRLLHARGVHQAQLQLIVNFVKYNIFSLTLTEGKLRPVRKEGDCRGEAGGEEVKGEEETGEENEV